jgi:outer membrane putative beta-barrel porin/alpha-amylase
MAITKRAWGGLGVAAVALLSGLAARDAAAQGCVASRMEAPSCSAVRSGVETELLESYNLPQKRWQLSFGYRGYRSHRHFVGSVEQSAENVAKGTAERDRAATEVINHVNIPDFNVTYGATDRLSFSAYLPFFTAHRRSPVSGNRPSYVTEASGISDLILAARYWVADPHKSGGQNVSFGLGIKLPTGNDRAADDFLVRVDQATGVRITDRRPVDQSIQPGDGGVGLVAEVQAFKGLGKFTAFASGSYLSNPEEQNDFLRDPSAVNPDPTTKYLSIADQYAARLGVGMPVGKRFGVSLAGRLEGVPSSDLIGGDLGRRRPGYSIAIEPGVTYARKGYYATLSVPYLVHRVRTQSYSDKLASQRTGEHVNGDAAFADVVIILGLSRRF